MVIRMAARKAKVWRLTEGQRRLVEENISLAKWAVNYWANRRAKTNRVSEDDLLGAAYEGLWRAACRYDPRRVFIHDGKEKRAKFSTYAVPVMLDAMSRLCRHAFVITMPQYVCQLRKDRIGNHHLAALDQVVAGSGIYPHAGGGGTGGSGEQLHGANPQLDADEPEQAHGELAASGTTEEG